MKYTINDLSFGGKYHNECWNPQFNKEATIPNALVNCTAEKWSSKVASQYIYSDHAVNLNVTYIAGLSANTNFWLYAGGGSSATATGYVRDICLL